MMQQPPGGGGAGGNGEVPIAPPTGQMSREAKHMRVMLMLCVKEKIFDQNALEVIFNQWIQCEQQNDGHVEETDAAFRRSIGRMYGPKSKDFLNAIDRAKVKLEQLKERKSKGELGTGPLVGGSMPGPPSNAPMQGIPNGQPHLQNLGNPQSMQHIQQQQQQHHIPQQQSQQLLSQPQSQQLLAQQQLQQTPQVMQQYYKPQPNVAMTGQPLPHIQQTQQFQQTQPSYKLPSNITQNLPSGSVQSLPHHNQPIQPMIVNQTSITYDNRPPTMMNPTPPEMRPLPNMNPIPVPHNSQSMDQHGRVAPPIAAPIVESVDEDNIKQEDQKKKGGGRKKPPEEGEEGKRKKDAKKQKGKGADAAEKEAPKVVGTVGGLPFLEVKQPVNVSPSTGDELDNLTEKPNLLQEGLQATDRGIMTGYIIDGGLLIKEETTSRQMMRDNIAIGEKLDSSPDRIEFEPFMEKNVVGKDILDHAMQTVLNMKMDINPESRKLLSDGIQSHLRTIVEGALDISRKRLNRTACGNFYDSFQHFKQNNGAVSEHHLSNVAIKWGPNVAGILSEEEAKLKQFYKDYCDIDEEKLKEKMKLFDEERSKAAGMKRKIGNVAVEVETQSTWWEKDQSFEDEGILSYEKIAEVWKKNDIAAKHELGPNIKRRSQKKVETPLPDSTNDLLATAQRTNNDSSVPMDTEDLRSSEIEWRNQTCPISIPPDTYVTSDDIYFVISKVNSRKGGLIGSRADREKIRKARFQWKLFAR